MKPWQGLIILALVAVWVIHPGPSRAEEQQKEQQNKTDYTLGKVVITEEHQPGPIQENRSEPASETVIPRKTIEMFGGPGQTNPYKSLNLIPSINAENSDPYGLVMDQNSIRIRGQYGYTYSRLSQTINGVPLSINVGQGSMGNLLDMENIDSISVTKGGVPANKGFGFGNAAGALDMRVLEPAKEAGASASQKIGSFGFTRTTGRIDSGELPTKSRLFGSFSYSEEDKWRGTGDIDRLNFMGGWSQQLVEDRLKFDFYGIYNKFNQDEFKPLTYIQSQNDKYYRGHDWNSRLTGIPQVDYNYYKYNRQAFEEYAFFGDIEMKLWEGAKLDIKPYLAGNDGRRYNTSNSATPVAAASLGYTLTDMKARELGFVAQVEQKIDPVEIIVGYWCQNMQLYPSPMASQRYFPIRNGGAASFGSWQILTEIGDRNFSAPFIQAKADLDKFHLQAGLKYLMTNLPSVTAYNTAGLLNVGYPDVLDFNPALKPSTSTGEVDANVWLPNAGLSYDLTDHLTARFMYGRNYAYPWLTGLYSTLNSNIAKFNAKGIDLQHIWSRTKLETSENFDFGLRYDDGKFSLAPSVFYSTFQNKQVTVYNPYVSTAYTQNEATAESKGAELEASWKPYDWLTLFGSGSYNRFQFTNNPGASSATIPFKTKGKDVPDAPQWVAKTGFTAEYKGFTATPSYRYVDSRFGDVLNIERVRGYHLVDLYLAYTPAQLKYVTFNLSLQNILDQRYVGTIRNSLDDNLNGSATYVPGAPFTAVAGVSIKF